MCDVTGLDGEAGPRSALKDSRTVQLREELAILGDCFRWVLVVNVGCDAQTLPRQIASL